MPHCAAAGCNFQSKGNKGTEISLHVFPRDGKLREVWESVCGRKELPKDPRLCSRHFTEHDFEDLHRLRLLKELTGASFKRRLKPGAAPTVFLHKEPKNPGEMRGKPSRKCKKTEAQDTSPDLDRGSDLDSSTGTDTDTHEKTNTDQPNTTSELGMDTMPVDRMRMRPWLEEQIDSCQIPGLKWVNKEERIFQIPWLHGAHQNWDLEKDAPLFMRWAIHTGKYRPGVERPNPRMWKSNFRCALNSLPDIVEVKDKHIRRGSNAFRVYKMLSSKRSMNKEMKIKRMNVKVSSSEQFIPDGSDFTKPDLSRVRPDSAEETDSAEDFSIKEEPDDVPIKLEEEDFPCTVVTVRIGENGKVEETDEPVFSLDPQMHLKNNGQKVNSLVTDRSDDSGSTRNRFSVKLKKQRLLQGLNGCKADDRKRKCSGKTAFGFGDGGKSGEASGLTSSMS